MVMPFVRKSLSGCLSINSITEEQAKPMVLTPFPTEELDGHNQPISFKVELGVLIPSCHQTNITQSRKYSYKVIVKLQIYTITLVRHLNVQHVGGGQTSRGTKYNQ